MHASIENIKRSVNTLDSASLDDLKNVEWVKDLIRSTGLTYDPVRNQKNEEWQIENDPMVGIEQVPEQFAPCLVFLSDRGIKRVIEIGTWCGWTTCFTTAYFRRFEPSLSVVTIDKMPEWSAAVQGDELLSKLPIEYRSLNTSKITSYDVTDIDVTSDLCIIDAGHSYSDTMCDWVRFGQHSKNVFFHDVNDRQIRVKHGPVGGSCHEFWEDLKTLKTLADCQKFEFFDHPSEKELMGIGLLCR